MLGIRDGCKIKKRSFEVGGARVVETYEEALRRGWYDVAELFADDEPEPDESIQ
jgi:hypothetical protein